MPQISLYVEDEVLKKVEIAAKMENKSISKWVASQIKSNLKNQYPADYFSLFGSISDDSFTEPKEIDFDKDVSKEQL